MASSVLNVKIKTYKLTYWVLKLVCFLRINPKRKFFMNLPVFKMDLGKKVSVYYVKDLIK